MGSRRQLMWHPFPGPSERPGQEDEVQPPVRAARTGDGDEKNHTYAYSISESSASTKPDKDVAPSTPVDALTALPRSRPGTAARVSAQEHEVQPTVRAVEAGNGGEKNYNYSTTESLASTKPDRDLAPSTPVEALTALPRSRPGTAAPTSAPFAPFPGLSESPGPEDEVQPPVRVAKAGNGGEKNYNYSTTESSASTKSDKDLVPSTPVEALTALPKSRPGTSARAPAPLGVPSAGAKTFQDAEKRQMSNTREVPPTPTRGKPKASVLQDELGDPMDDLPEHERHILKRQLETLPTKTSYRTLFRYATKWDIAIMCFSATMAAGGGLAQPLMTVVFGSLSGSFSSLSQGTVGGASFTATLDHRVLYFIYIAIAEFCTIYCATVGFSYTGEHISRKIREQYLKATLRQNIGYYDKLGAGEITTRITADTNLIQDGISQKVGLTITALSTFIAAFAIGFIKYWALTLILCSSIFTISLAMGVGSAWLVKWNKKSLEAYAIGGSVAEEVISSIRNATAFSTQDKLARQYDTYLKDAEKWGVKHKSLLGVLIGVLFSVIYLTYGLAFWQGSRFLVDGSGVTLSDILTILLSIMIGAFSLGNVAPNAQAFTTAAAAAGKIFATIDRVSPMDPDSDEGLTLDHIEGNVELRHIRHIYPSRPEVLVMEDVSLYIPASKTTALVGASGSGKSTIVGLVERFYDPVGGQVFLDGVDVSTLNLRFLRRQISLVSQEPLLFGTTIFGNIAHGLIGTKYENMGDEKKAQLIYDAAKMANAHDFVSELPEGYETNVGERGFLLSGGQKQRIAIARAVVSDPKILLLDEATSALDTKSEGVVQAALDKAAEGRTTIIIAHRLSTIKNASNIVVMQEGRIVEQGTHDQLLGKRGAYFNLVEAQQIAAQANNEDSEDFAVADDVDMGMLEKSRSQVRNTLVQRTTTSGKSVSSQTLDGKPAGQKGGAGLWTLIKLVASFNKKEWKIMLIGLFFCIISGLGNPVQSVFFAKSIVSLARPPSEYASLRSDADFWAVMFVMLAFVELIAHIGHGILLAICSERLIHRVRDRAFRTMLRQDLAWFDLEENSAGALTSFLSTQTTAVAGLSGATLGTILTVLTTLIGSFVLSLSIGWKLALVCISTVPVVLTCGFMRFWILDRFQGRAKRAYEKSASYACEATSAIRTVASLTREGDVWENYHRQLVEQEGKSLRSMLKSATLYAGSQSFMFLAIALGFWYGGTLLVSGEYSLLQFFICFQSVIFGAQSAGTIFSFAPDMGKAKQAAFQLKVLFDRRPDIDSWSTKGKMVDHVAGALEFKDVHFRYPTRPEQPVLRGLDLSVKPGEYIALVGPSGCGKSTTISLLERFYSPLAGSITLDGHPIESLNLKSYRSHIALVSQEPTLYQGTIRENILLGADHEDNVGDEQIEKACADANILSFIQSLPDGFSTSVGGKGVLLSGGQKQRIAIARALLRNPKVLLLDEATSALDSESEKVVQDALDKAAKGRSTIAVAHRLSTIQRADCIYVFEGGVIVEQGTHEYLMKKRGRYRELVSLQSLGRTG